MFDQSDIIHSYTRAQALADGVLVEVPAEIASEAGFKVHLALTSAVWEQCVDWTQADSDHKGFPQDQQGRLWDVLWMARSMALRNKEGNNCIFTVLCVPKDGTSTHARPVQLVLNIGPGDEGEPVATITLPGED